MDTEAWGRESLKLIPFLILCTIFLGFMAYAEPVDNPYLMQSPWAQGHRTPGMQASTPYPGPMDAGRTLVQQSIFEKEIGQNLGTSPWLLLSEKKYPAHPNARTLWGSSLKGVFKYWVEGERFQLVDTFKLNGPLSLSWNIRGLHDAAGGRFVVPQPLGLRRGEDPKSPCAGTKDALLVFRDGRTPDSPIRCEKKLEFDEVKLRGLCGAPAGWKMAYSSTAVEVLQTGDLLTQVVFRPRARLRGTKKSYLAIVDNQLSQFKACSVLGDGRPSNASPHELIAPGQVAIYTPLDNSIVKTLYNSRTNRLSRLWEAPVNFRRRTGTTPTLVGKGKDKFVVAVDAQCAVTNHLTGNIACDEDKARPSRLVVVRRNGSKPTVESVNLPAFIKTVENSPSATGNTLVVADYGGYKPTLASGGVVALQWQPSQQQWKTLWANPAVQMNGITTISEASGLVYSSGMEKDQYVYAYGLQLFPAAGRNGGELVFRKKVGPANLTWDAGNQTVINDDKSLMFATWTGVVRLYEKP